MCKVQGAHDKAVILSHLNVINTEVPGACHFSVQMAFFPYMMALWSLTEYIINHTISNKTLTLFYYRLRLNGFYAFH